MRFTEWSRSWSLKFASFYSFSSITEVVCMDWIIGYMWNFDFSLCWNRDERGKDLRDNDDWKCWFGSFCGKVRHCENEWICGLKLNSFCILSPLKWNCLLLLKFGFWVNFDYNNNVVRAHMWVIESELLELLMMVWDFHLWGFGDMWSSN